MEDKASFILHDSFNYFLLIIKEGTMKNLFFVIFIFLMAFTFQKTEAQNKKFGIGVIIGEPTGLSGKLWVSNNNAISFGVGWYVKNYRFGKFDSDYERESRTHIHIDYLWHSFNAIGSNRQFPLFYGIGVRINSGPQYPGTLAVRGVLGIEWLPQGTPLDVFIEVVPNLTLISSTEFGIDAALGARIFF